MSADEMADARSALLSEPSVDSGKLTYRRVFENSLFFTVVFPNIRVFSSTHAFQPLTLPFVCFHALISRRMDRFALYFVAVYVLCVSASFSIHPNVSGASILYCVLYLSGPLTFFYFLRQEYLSPALINFGLAFTFLTTAEQFFVGSKAIESLFTLVFAHRPEAVQIGLRGVGGFMSEPSHSGRLYVCLLFLAYVTKTKYRGLWLGLALPFLLMNRSGSAFILLLGFLAAISYRKSKATTLVLLGSALMALPYVLSLEFRFMEMFVRIAHAWQHRSNTDLVSTLGLAGGARLIQTTIGFLSIGPYPLGNGIGSAHESFLQVAQSLGLSFADWEMYVNGGDDLRPNSYVSQIVYDFGWIGLPILASLFIPLLEFEVPREPLRGALLLLGLAQIIVASTTTIPWPWIMIAASLIKRRPAAVQRAAGP